jgi:hypothetical protein
MKRKGVAERRFRCRAIGRAGAGQPSAGGWPVAYGRRNLGVAGVAPCAIAGARAADLGAITSRTATQFTMGIGWIRASGVPSAGKAKTKWRCLAGCCGSCPREPWSAIAGGSPWNLVRSTGYATRVTRIGVGFTPTGAAVCVKDLVRPAAGSRVINARSKLRDQYQS